MSNIPFQSLDDAPGETSVPKAQLLRVFGQAIVGISPRRQNKTISVRKATDETTNTQ